PLKFEIVIANTSTGEILYSLPLGVNETTNLATYSHTSTSIRNEVFDRYFTASFITAATSDNKSTNGRYNARLQFVLEKKDMNNMNIAVGIIAEGRPGARLDIVGKNNLGATEFKSYGLPGWSDSNSDLSVNSTACGDNVIAVGAYSTRAVWGTLDGSVHENSIRLFPGRVAGFSGYGVTYDGRSLPHVLAPGVSVVSSLNSYHKTTGSVSEYTYNGRNYCWGAQSGTSMAAPVVSGIIATWLQYNPDLTTAEVLDIIGKTSVID
ncbi:MAG: S8 family serine peptidase, partial [Muribaculaceae bacterium]|nr:S8 family serine peptidase [Muribaculaceae bacterium]